MIKLKAYIGELSEFVKFLDRCINSDAKTIDTVKEYYLTWSLEALKVRIIKKAFARKIEGKPDTKKVAGRTVEYQYAIPVEEPEMIALSLYFARHEVHPYLKPLEEQIVSQIPGELIAVLKPMQTHNPQHNETTDYFDFSNY